MNFVIGDNEGNGKAYEVIKNIVIDESDWSYLNETNENKLNELILH